MQITNPTIPSTILQAQTLLHLPPIFHFFQEKHQQLPTWYLSPSITLPLSPFHPLLSLSSFSLLSLPPLSIFPAPLHWQPDPDWEPISFFPHSSLFLSPSKLPFQAVIVPLLLFSNGKIRSSLAFLGHWLSLSLLIGSSHSLPGTSLLSLPALSLHSGTKRWPAGPLPTPLFSAGLLIRSSPTLLDRWQATVGPSLSLSLSPPQPALSLPSGPSPLAVQSLASHDGWPGPLPTLSLEVVRRPSLVPDYRSSLSVL